MFQLLFIRFVHVPDYEKSTFACFRFAALGHFLFPSSYTISLMFSPVPNKFTLLPPLSHLKKTTIELV